MKKTINMESIRYLNLFEKVTRVRAKSCFFYNNYLVFVVPPSKVSKSIGKKGKNVKKISSILNKKIKIVALPKGIKDAEKFLRNVVAPIEFDKLEVNDKEVIIKSKKRNRAVLFGRGKSRKKELDEIVKEFFDRQLKIE